ncbi:hypothetical protein NMY22_g16051 [Coprinellus aureogranulatus]|nr:hypothetical protein NMY22_g16051 [Coprinellus aureogranulatus]
MLRLVHPMAGEDGNSQDSCCSRQALTYRILLHWTTQDFFGLGPCTSVGNLHSCATIAMDFVHSDNLGWAKCAVLASFVIYAFSALRRNKRKGLPLPPGPPGLPIIGNLLDVPPEGSGGTAKRLPSTIGSDVIYLNLLGQDIVVLNSLDSCKELLEKRSAIYSSRPNMPMINDFIGFDWHFAFMPYGDEWKGKLWRVFPMGAIHQKPRLLKHIRNYMLLLLDDPDHFREHTRLTAGAFILDITYSLEIKSPRDPYITQAEQGMHAMSLAGTAATYAVDFIPSLKWLPSWIPGVKFKSDAKVWRPHVEAMARKPFKYVEEGLKRGDTRPCVASELLRELDEGDPNYQQKRKVIHDVLGSVYAAGSDTTVSTAATFLLAMAQNPDIQKKAQGIVDKVVATQGRLPDFTEYKTIPYIEAIVREVLRWRPVTPVGAPHSVIEDDVYGNFHIPKGATVISNCYAILHNPELYGSDTEYFDPSRFLNPTQTKINEDMPLGLDAFGFGRRICPGLEIAFESIWLIVMSVLAVFDISKPDVVDQEFGKYSSGLISHPLPFKIKIVPRSKEAEGLIRSGVVFDD